jgi:hypothetical protein
MPGVNRWADLVQSRKSVYALCKEAGIDRSRVTKAKRGQHILSLAACKSLAEKDPEIRPVALFLEGVRRVAKNRIDGGDETGPAAAAAAITAAIRELQQLDKAELTLEDEKEITRLVKELEKLFSNALANATSDANSNADRPIAEPVTTKSARDAHGKRYKETGAGGRRDLFVRRMDAM